MKILSIITLFLFFTFLSVSVYSQLIENTGWLFVTHTTQLSKKWVALTDVQVRSNDKFRHIETLLLRGALGYKFNKKHAVALGYAYKGDWTTEEGKSLFNLEHRIYEQYLFNTNIKKTEFTLRFRQEQRFVNDSSRFQFSQRLRAFVSFQIPLFANADFTKGIYTTIQDELFLNTHHKQNVNNSFFDQNRPFISIGYRWSKKVDTEIGYMYWLQRETEGDASTNVFQLMLTTSL